MRKPLAALVTLLMVFYPFAVLWALRYEKLLWISFVLIFAAVLRYLLQPNRLFLPLTALALLCGGLSLLLQNDYGLKFYPVLMNLGTCIIFAYTLYSPPSMIERFARLHQPDLPESGVQWTRKVTQVWCVFLLLNAIIALMTVLFFSTQIWAIYNGFISYLLMGALLLAEFILRKRHQAKQMR
ncbi:septation protein IspZ [Acinetobacter puyangensis]|uniref:Uncharacterized membrane protein n=1 Tax=Acinetobacter puyangensis TaxID=1096779 RepID=A0A240E384_9GAMM|nr:Clp protease [Acinetobacter puyangensis]SNX43238.1 Uncharacterized membrane protein [Acinetobacter puyangensis]